MRVGMLHPVNLCVNRLRGRIDLRWLSLVLLTLGSTFALGTTAEARLGGGESFHGRSSDEGGGGGGGGGGDLLFYLLLQLIVRYPAIGIPVAIVAIVMFVYISRNQQETFSPAPVGGGATPLLGQSVDAAIDELRQIDPDFSLILFEDFIYTLFGKVHQARGQGKLADYAPYLAGPVREQLAEMGMLDGRLVDVTGVIIGSAKITRVRGLDDPEITIAVGFTANYTETRQRDGAKPSSSTLYVEELWELTRSREVKSRPPEKIAVLDCPRCGSSLELTPEGACVHCGVRVERGDFHWFVSRIRLFGREAQGPLLTQDVPETGTNLPTIFDRRLQPMQEMFQQVHTEADWARMEERFRQIFLQLQQAWSRQDWEKARPFVSDSLFQYFAYWMDAYRRQRLSNKLDNIEVGRLILVKLRMDRYYDAVTVRIFASMTDVLIDANGKRIRGDARRPRAFSEYWTFIRRQDAKESEGTMMNCPNCGAALKVNMAGKCEFCGSKLTSGEFDWVLSRIEQDEAYHG